MRARFIGVSFAQVLPLRAAKARYNHDRRHERERKRCSPTLGVAVFVNAEGLEQQHEGKEEKRGPTFEAEERSAPPANDANNANTGKAGTYGTDARCC